MGRIYNANGAKMNVAEIVAEVLQIATSEQKKVLVNNINKYDGIASSHAKLAHGILDSYKSIDSTSEQGMRLRKLLDNIMTKYQKSANTTADDQSQYNYLICELSK